VTSVDAATIAATDLIHTIKNSAPTAPFAPSEGEKMAALKQVASIFASVAPSAQNAKTNTLKTYLPPVTSEGASSKGPLQFPSTSEEALCEYYLAQNTPKIK